MRIFVNNVDGFLAGAICADLAKLSSSMMGTLKRSNSELIPPMVKKIIPRIEVRKLLKTVASCEIVVYDLHDADLEELELVLQTLHSSELTQNMVFVLVSSVGIWARTQRELEFEPELRPAAQEPGVEPEAAAAAPAEASDAPAVEVEVPERPRRPVQLKCEDYIRRIPTPKFQEWKSIETLVLALKKKGCVQPYVVCAGIPYGNGEDAFFGLFKAAWQHKDTLRIIGDGHNYIPMVHARDAARLVRLLVEEKPSMEYHLAVDRGEVTQRGLVQAVADEFGIGGEIRSVSVAEAILAELADVLTMNLRLEPSPRMLVTEERVPSRSESSKAEAASIAGSEAGAEPVAPAPTPVRFRWWCEEGLAANASKVAGEFVRWRRLEPVRFVVAGPPGCPSVPQLGARLAERYELPYVGFDALMEEQRRAETALGQQLRDRLDDIAAALGNPKSQGPFVLTNSLNAQVLEASALRSKACHYRGFVLSGYPQTIEECVLSFMEEAPPPEPKEGEAAEAPVAEAPPPPPQPQPKTGGKADKSKDKALPPEEPPVDETNKVPRFSVKTDALILLSCTEDLCLQALQAGEKPISEREFQIRMDRWKKDNPEEGPSPVAAFFRDKFGSQVIRLHANQINMDDDVQRIAEAVESKRSVVNFLPPARRVLPGVAEEPRIEDAKNMEALARAEAELRKRRKEQDERLEQIRKEEHARLERHSEPLRQYMSSLVVPTLASGLVEVCRSMPEDPVGYLAEYLAVYSDLSRKHNKKPGLGSGGRLNRVASR